MSTEPASGQLSHRSAMISIESISIVGEGFTAGILASLVNGVIVTSYGTLRRDIDLLERVRWSLVALDEAQNCTPVQIKMFLTRLGDESKMIVTGDPTQVDLPPGKDSGLLEAIRLLGGIEEIDHIAFTREDVVRRELVGKIVDAYESAPRKGERHG